MKKFLFFAASAVLVLAGCAKNEVVVSPDNQKAIEFSTYVGKTPITKGENHTSAYGRDYGLIVIESNDANWALSNDFLTAETTKTFTLHVDGSGNTSLTQSGNEAHLYWPADATQNLQFYAMYPNPSTENGLAPYTVTIEQTIANQKDYLWARAKGSYATVGNSPINLGFEHLLSKLNITASQSAGLIANNPTTVTITELTIGKTGNNFHSTVSIDPTKETSAAVSVSGDTMLAPWTLTGTTTSGTTTPWAAVPENDTVTLTDGDNANLILAPENITLPVTVKYTVAYSGVSNSYEKTANIVLDLKTGKSYIINLELPAEEQHEITFTVTDNVAWATDGTDPTGGDQWTDSGK